MPCHPWWKLATRQPWKCWHRRLAWIPPPWCTATATPSIAKCLYEGMPQMMTSTPQDNMASATIIRVQLQSQLEPSSVVLHCADLQQWYTCKHQALDGLVRGPKDDLLEVVACGGAFSCRRR